MNITTPSAAGVSQNQYQQFDVPAQGAILNNSPTIVKTQIGGLVPGNPNLTGAPARIIVNQVTGTLPSNLAGYLEVAGNRAEVVVSNPNGLTCHGCGFINTSRAVLTTGLPVFGGSGSLEAFRVTDGRLRITGSGLNAGNLERAALLARAVEINAAVHAQQLDVIAGLNDIDAATFGIHSRQAAATGKPSFALDVSRLGGMYAGKIRLIGTEAGVGVNLDGHVSANQGALVLDSAGQLQISGKLQARSDIRVKAAADLSIRGDTLAEGQLTLETARNLVSSGSMRGARDVKLDAGNAWHHTGTVSAGRHLEVDAASIASTGVMAAGAETDATQGATGNISLSTAGRLQAGGTHTATGNIGFMADVVDLSDSTSTTRLGLRIDARRGAVTMARATTRVGDTTHITASGDVFHDQATLSTSSLFIAGASLSNDNGRLLQWGASSPFRIALSGPFSNRQGQVQANSSNLSLTSGQIDNTAGKIEHAGAGVFRLVTGAVGNTGGTLATNGAMIVDAGDWRNDQGTVSAKQSLAAGIRGQLTNSAGLMQTGGLFSLTAHDIKNLGGRLLALGNANFRLSADKGIENGRLGTTLGEIAGRGDVVLAATSLANSGAWTAQGSLLIDAAGDLLNVGGRIVARRQVTVAARGAFDNTRGTLNAGEALSLQADAIDNTLGQMQSRSLSVYARHLNNRSGSIGQTGIGAHDLAQLHVAQRLSNHMGSIHLAARDATIDAAEFGNAGGTVAHAGSGVLSINGQALGNRNGRIGTNGGLRLNAESLENSEGQLTALRHLTFNVREAISNASGRIAANANIAVEAGSLDNTAGRLYAGKSLALKVAADVVNNAGYLAAGGHLNAEGGGSFVNRSGRVSAHHGLHIKVADKIDNTDGELDVSADNGHMRVFGRQLDNAGGSLANAGTGAIDIAMRERLHNRASQARAAHRGGSIAGNGAINVSADGIENIDGARIAAGTSLSLTSTGDIDNRLGRLHANGPLSATANHNVKNANGAIHSGKALKLTATGALDNTGGSIETAGDPSIGGDDTLTVFADALDNTDGRIVNGTRSGSGSNDLAITAEAIVNAQTGHSASDRPIGLIGGNGRVFVTAFSLMNGPNAQMSAAANLSLSVRDKLGNAGTLFSGTDLDVTWRDAARTRVFHNTGDVQAGRNASLAANELDHRAGGIAVNRNLNLRVGSLLGNARVRAGNDLSIALPGDYIYGADHTWQADGSLTLDVGGLLRVHGALGAIKQLTVNAANVVNAGQGRLRGGSVLLNVAGDITNETRIDGDDVRLRSIRFVNTGAVMGGRIRFDGESVRNTGARAVLAATQQLDLFATGDVLNENGATLFSLGTLRLAAGETRDAQGFLTQQTGRFINRSAVMEAGGDVDIATREFVNDRSYVNILRGVDEGETRQVRDLWIAGYVALPDADSRARCAALRGAACETLPTTHMSHSLSVDGEPAMVEQKYSEIDANGEEVRKTRLVPNPRNQTFTQWRWNREARAALSSEKLHAVGSPISVTIPKRGVTALDADAKTFSLEKPIVEVYQPYAFSQAYDTRNITQRAVQHFESVSDDGQGNWVIRFWPDFDPSAHIRPTVVDQSNSTVTGAHDEGVRIFRRGYGIQDGRDTNEYRRRITVRSKTDVMGDVADPGILTSQGTIRLNVGNGTALNHASTISAGGDLQVRGNGGQITSRSIGLERVERIAQSSDLYWHEKRGNSDRWFTTVDLGVTERRAIVGGLPSLISSNGTTHLRGRDVTIETATADGTVIGNRHTDSDVGTAQRVAVGENPATVSTGRPSPVDALVAKPPAFDISGAVQTLDAVSGGIPGLELPRSALFTVVTTPGHPYLVETDSRFTDRGTSVSSNYMLDLLGIAPDSVERRLGDGFYEAKLVREQILTLTGRASLGLRDNAASAAIDAQFRTLLAQGARAARDLELRVGIRLTSEQMRALTDDIVWLVRQTVTLPDGTTATVLVPTVYLAHGKRVVMQPGGALVTGRDVIVEATHQVSNSGQIVGNASTRIRALDVENRGVIGGSRGSGGSRKGNAGMVEVVASRDVQNVGGEIAGERVHITAGRDVVVTSQSRTAEWGNGSQKGKTTAVDSLGRISAGDAVAITAGRDLSVTGAAIDAGGNANLAAGRDISLGAIATSRDFGGGSSQSHSRTRVTEHVSSAINTGGDATFIAGRDVSTAGTSIDAGKAAVIVAARDVEIGAVTDSIADSGRVRGDTYAASVETYEETVQGSRLHANGAIGIAAGQIEAVGRLLDERNVTAYVTTGDATRGDVTILGAYLSAGASDGARPGTPAPSTIGGKSELKIVATGDVTVGGVAARYDDERWSRSTHAGLLSSTTEENYRDAHGTRTTGSTLSGDAVTVVAGRDVAITGSQVVADSDLTISAERHATITSAEDRSRSLSVSEKTTSGVFGSGFSVTIGSRSEKDKQRREQVSQTGSVVGSVSGDVTIRTGNDYRQEGSTVIARDGDVSIAGKRVSIVESEASEQRLHEREIRQAGLTVAISNPVLNAAQTVGQMGKAVGKVNDARMKALGVAAGALAVKNAADTVKNLKDAANVNIAVTVGGSKQESRETNDSTTSNGSAIRAGGSVTLSALGDGDQSSLLVRGSEIAAGKDVKLTSDGSLDILAATDTSAHHRNSTGVSGGVGLGISMGSQGVSMGVTGNASASR
ncbi:hemagglutinin repeat-containing protein, partial [Pandoraea sp. NPDC087047]|uniref:two-partner secretion domain-containing protein n=1 Tax=Pandoraea sp. NPDC087047 TaxID=3364390 RepID=UPI00381023A7